MRKILFLLSFISCGLILSQTKTTQENSYYFYENKGQIVDQDGKENADVKYLYHSAGLNVQLRPNRFSYDIYETKKTRNPNFSKDIKNKIPDGETYHTDEFLFEKLIHRVDIELVNSNKNSKIIAEGKSPDYDNYFNLPNNPKGIENVHRYQRVLYKNIYSNIDLVFFKPKDITKPIEYNFIINPGGKISDIKMKFTGAPASIKDGKLAINVRFGEIQEDIPNSWITKGKRNENINVSFRDLGDQIFGFNTPIETSDKTIIIDPVPTRIWGSYVGGYGEDYGKIKTDSQSTGYLFGGTNSTTNIATSGAYQQNSMGNYDAFLMKITKTGQRLWGTYFGTSQDDAFYDVDLDENFNIYAGGRIFRWTSNTDIVLVKFNSNGGLVFQKDFIGNSPEDIYTVSYNQNQVFIGGQTMSPNFPTLNAAQPNKLSPSGYTDGYLTALDTSGNIIWSSFFGASDHSTGIFKIFSSVGDLEVIGSTQSHNIPMINPFQPTFAGVIDGLYLKFSKTGTLLRSSYFGNSIQDEIREARIIDNTLILAGEFPDLNATPYTRAAIWRVNLNTNAVSKTAFSFHYQMQLTAYIDKIGNVYFCGLGEAGYGNISTPGSYMHVPGSLNASFLLKYNTNNIKEWGTFYTGNGSTQASYATMDNEGYIYLTGMSSNNTTGIATPGTFQQQGGHPSNDMYVAKFKDCTSTATVTSNSPVCINSSIQLNATGGTTYSWTGPNGFTSTQQNPTIPNATVANSGTYICQISGSGGCDGSFTVNVIVGDTVAPVPNIANLSDITGDCHTSISNFPTATDNCAGTITATTTDPLSYSIPGTYAIHWIYNDGHGNTATQNQNVIVTSPALPTTTNVTQTFCATNQPKISNIQITGQNIKWYDTSGNILPSTTPLVNGQTYYASQTINGCESNKIAIQVVVNSTPKPVANTTQDFCASANPTLANLVVNGTSLVFYSTAGNVLPLTTPLVHGQTYFVTQTINGCKSEKLAIAVTLSTNNVPAQDVTAAICNTSTGTTMSINLHSYEATIIANPNNYTFVYTDSAGNNILNPSSYLMTVGSTVIHVKVSTPDGCFIVIRLSLTLNPKPKISLPDQIDFCQGKIVTLDAGNGFTSYLWNTGATTQTIVVSTPGNYSVKVTNNFGCENTANTQISYSILAEIVSVTVTNNSATILLSATGNYEYSLDNINWQDSNVFTNLSMGEYIVYVRTKSGCIIGQKNFSIFNIPNTITPNGDGINDKWRIRGLENYTGTEVGVYDRKGIPVFKDIINKKPFEWDGKYNSNPLPTGSYWYIIKVSDGRFYNGWLLIKNRE